MSGRRIVRESDLEAAFPPLALELRRTARRGWWLVLVLLAVSVGALVTLPRSGWLVAVPFAAACIYAAAGPILFLLRLASIKRRGIWQDWLALPSAPQFLLHEFVRDFLSEWNARWMLAWACALPIVWFCLGSFVGPLFLLIAVVGLEMALQGLFFTFAVSSFLADAPEAAANVRRDIRATREPYYRWDGWNDWWSLPPESGRAGLAVLAGLVGTASIVAAFIAVGFVLLAGAFWTESWIVIAWTLVGIFVICLGGVRANDVWLRWLDSRLRRSRP